MKRLVINTLEKKSKIHKELQGHFSEHLGRCIYEGLYVGENNTEIPNVNGMRSDVVEALKAIRIPVLRWPGGCFADEYHWQDGIGPKESRKRMINTHWGGVVEDNSFGTHEFMELCDQLGCEAYINANVGSGSVREMSEWVEYMTFEGLSPMSQLREKNGRKEAWHPAFLGVGNENWGCGGNMTPEYYANEFRQYSTYCRTYDPGFPLYKIACGPNAGDYQWMERLCRVLSPLEASLRSGLLRGISLHYYTVPGDFEHKKSATDFDVETYYETLHKAYYMEELIRRHGTIMDQFDPEKKIGLIIDEWGSWYEVEPGTNPGFLYQQNTMRDAMIAGITLNIFNQYSDRVRMANIAQLVNVLQSVILTDGRRMIKTPTYHVFDLFKEHQENTLLGSYLENEMIGAGEWRIPELSQSASQSADGSLVITLVNVSDSRDEEIRILPVEYRASSASGRIVSGEIHEKNSFEDTDAVCVRAMDETQLVLYPDGAAAVKLPACSAAEIILRK
ncbi:alpha-N-arabinofuranosidase [Lachnoclostridium sp. Marseille-P6806]|uniref:alpha-N-arabinofuranosidase n=1 Tax=Lachnoclostridium sp. Marseille-P6806 TaxID=2364793 RepID=UPI001030E01E|nr:alpha-L-arabinofuranosidase C-terminal domain-containing protein [Lachnoclostridium sp. Marseille-P6806]